MSTQSRLAKLNFRPGINRESTEYAEEGSWYDGNKVRFRQGRPENLRGYSKRSTSSFDGTGRDLLAWSDNDTFKFASFGTEKKLYEYNDNSILDITPIKEVSVGTNVSAVVTVDGTNNGFYTVDGSTRVSVSVSSHGAETGDFITFTSATTIGGTIDLTGGTFAVSVLGDNQFSFDASVTANASQSKVGTATLKYLLPTGTDVAIQGLGYGAGVYNAGVSTTGVRAWSEAASSSNIVTRITQWTLDNWGEDILACRRGGRIYFWDSTRSSTPPRAGFVSASPSINNYIVVSPNDRHLISLGSNEYATGTYNPLLVRWADQNNYNNFTPSISSTSGENILADGTEIIGATKSRNSIMIWTDNSVWGMQFVGPPFTFSFTQMGSNCGLIAPHAAVDYDGISYWMGDDNFYLFDGRVKNLPCTVRRYIFDDFNITNKDKVYAGINSEFKEVIWLYPSSDSTECDRYVIFNTEEQAWYYGTGINTTYFDKIIFDNTITTGVSVSSFFYNNEPDGIFTANGVAQTSFIESAVFEINPDGTNLLFADRLIPDFTLSGGNLGFSITVQNFPVNDQIKKGPFTISPTTKKVDFRARGRQAIVRVSSGEAGTSWRYGSLRLSLQPDGLR